MISDFITAQEAEDLIAFFATCEFKDENGHSVISFGEPYPYTNSKSSVDVPPIPDQLKPVFEKVIKLQIELYQSMYPDLDQSQLTALIINSCLVNKYEGPVSHISKHADKEVTINPESAILTVSIGESCDLKFIERESGIEQTVTCSDRSLYHMSRRSQEVFEHVIEPGSITDGVRYSLTFRVVSWKNKNSTCLLGDSNTGSLRYGSCKRSTFGELMPGQKFWCPRIDDIDPKMCMGYANAVLLCGINDVKQSDVQCESDVINIYNKLKCKVKAIQKLSPKTFIHVCRLLPTKNTELNMKVDTFNRLIHFDMLQTCKGVQCVDGFHKFADHNGHLACELSKSFDRQGRLDMLHLNRSGVSVLASLIKQSIFLRLHGGVDKRRHTSRLDGRLYSNVARGPPAPRR